MIEHRGFKNIADFNDTFGHQSIIQLLDQAIAAL
jgi:hypothetical protein